MPDLPLRAAVLVERQLRPQARRATPVGRKRPKRAAALGRPLALRRRQAALPLVAADEVRPQDQPAAQAAAVPWRLREQVA
jgi:hypothetical protein